MQSMVEGALHQRRARREGVVSSAEPLRQRDALPPLHPGEDDQSPKSPIDSKVAFPPALVVSVLVVRSAQNRGR